MQAVMPLAAAAEPSPISTRYPLFSTPFEARSGLMKPAPLPPAPLTRSTRSVAYAPWAQEDEKVAWALPMERIEPIADDLIGMIRELKGIDLLPMEKMDQCCGFGGTVAVKYDDILGAMVQAKVDCVKATARKTLICNEGG